MSGKVLQEENSRAMLTISVQETPQSNKLPQYTAAIFATLTAFIAGTCLAWTSPAIPILESPDSHIFVTTTTKSWIGSIITLGACLGAIPTGFLVNTIGRKLTLLILGFIIFISWIIIAFSVNLMTLLIGRFIAGLSIGSISVAAPLYVAELAEPRVRGTLGTFFQLQITIGVLFSYLLGFLQDFAIICYVLAICPIIFLLAFVFMPESPIHLYRTGKERGARISLQWLRGRHYDIEDEYQRIGDAIRNDIEKQSKRTTIVDVMKSKATIRALIVSFGLMIFQQLSGVSGIIFYLNQIFNNGNSTMASSSTLTPELCSIIFGIVQVIATYTSSLLMDRAGRRLLLIISNSIMAISLTILSSYFYFINYFGYTALIPLICLVVYIIVFSLGAGPIPWLMMGEIFPTNIKGPASSMAAALNWTTAFLVTNVFTKMMDDLGNFLTFSIFAIFCMLATIFVFMLVPETKGKAIEEIQRELAGGTRSLAHSTTILSVEKGTKIVRAINV